jgi:hypothetical protein
VSMRVSETGRVEEGERGSGYLGSVLYDDMMIHMMI